MSTASGKTTTIRKTFSRETSVMIEIQASPSVIWKLLTEAENYPKWNSTIVSIEGKIAKGEKIKLKSTLDTKRTFSLTVKEFESEKRLVWGDGQGNREYTIQSSGNGKATFTMDEKIGGLMFPLYASYIPPFDQSFEQFAADLKRASEAVK
ncbi:MAG: SRPBCC domain-containing protein [Cyclobacteriaceae bacterium]|nr:SRPBCC domain-containing protein [Cyclobacteriaceae bacterium]